MKTVFALLAFISATTLAYGATDKVVCYFGSWAKYRNGNGKFDVEDIDVNLCTHVIYTFIGLNTDGSIRILDSWNEINNNALNRFVGLKSRNPNLKTLIAIGGWGEGSETYSKVVGNPVSRAIFVKAIETFTRIYGFDGFDLDWEYPGQRGGAASDRTTFITLLKELRPIFDRNGWLLTAAVAASKSYHATSYDVPQMNTYLDFINIMSYDLHGAYEKKTGQNAPLYASSAVDKTDDSKLLNVHNVVKSWIAAGADSNKLVLGIGTYGRSFTLNSASDNGLGAPAVNTGNPGPYTQEPGFISYLEICEKQNTGSWVTVWDDEQKVPYTYSGNQWIGYDNVKSVKLKTQFAVDENLGGAMIWSIESEDARNVCGGGKFPLLQAINDVLKGSSPPSENTLAPPTVATTKAPTTATTAKPTTGAPAPTIPPTAAPNTPTQKPTTASPSTPTGVCSKAGYVRDPNQCNVFYYCSKVNATNPVTFKCGGTLVYDAVGGVCNYAQNVDC